MKLSGGISAQILSYNLEMTTRIELYDRVPKDISLFIHWEICLLHLSITNLEDAEVGKFDIK